MGRAAARARHELVERAEEEIRSGRADVAVVAEFLVDAALARAARCVNGGGGIYSELWILDEAGFPGKDAEKEVQGGRFLLMTGFGGVCFFVPKCGTL